VVRISVCVLDIQSEVDLLLSRAGPYGVRAFVIPMPFPVHYLPAFCHLHMCMCSY